MNGSQAIAHVSVPVPVLEDEGQKKLPRELRLLAFGWFDSHKGRFFLDQMGAASIMEMAKKWGIRFHADWEHAAIVKASKGDKAPAACWYDLDLRVDGLWAVNIDWTEEAAADLLAGRYKYFSPAFIPDDSGRVVLLVNIALTNLPATWGMEAILASSFADRLGITPPKTESQHMRRNHVVLLGLLNLQAPNGATEEQVDDLLADGLTRLSKRNTVVLSALGLPPDADEAKLMGAINALRTAADAGGTLRKEVLALTGAKSDTEALGALAAHRASHDKVVTLSTEVAELKSAQEKREVAELVAQGMGDGRITPALEEWAKGQSKPVLLSFLDKAPKSSVAVDPAPKGTPGADKQPTGPVPAWREKMMHQFNRTPADLAKARAGK